MLLEILMSDLKEQDVVICKKCEQPRIRIFSKKVGKNKQYIDKSGSMWNGLTCPSCTLVRIRQHMEKLRISLRTTKKETDPV